MHLGGKQERASAKILVYVLGHRERAGNETNCLRVDGLTL
jgi:hypothetical protein